MELGIHHFSYTEKWLNSTDSCWVYMENDLDKNGGGMVLILHLRRMINISCQVVPYTRWLYFFSLLIFISLQFLFI